MTNPQSNWPSNFRVLVLLASITLLLGCAQNAAFHPKSRTAIQFNSSKLYDFGYIEFSERGNIFNRSMYKKLLEQIQSRYQEQDQDNKDKKKKIAVVVFAHGWHHNASETKDEGNVAKFKALLDDLSKTDGPLREHRFVGVYLGWRGESINLPPFNYLTIFDRKAVSEEVGRGGVTEVLLTLRRLNLCGTIAGPCDVGAEKKKRVNLDIATQDTLKPKSDSTKMPAEGNRLVILGHSLGAALTFSALSDIFIEHLVNFEPREPQVCEDNEDDKIGGKFSEKVGKPCVVAEPFADAVILINPAIEANQALPLKEIMAAHQYPDEQHILMHVLGSESDWPVRYVFPVLQWVDGLLWADTSLTREYEYRYPPKKKPIKKVKTVKISETRLSNHSIANYAPFRTGWIGADEKSFRRCWNSEQRPDCKPSDEEDRMPVGPNEPIQFYLADKGLIDGHNGWEDGLNDPKEGKEGKKGNCRLQAWILTVIEESVAVGLRENFHFPDRFGGYLRKCDAKTPEGVFKLNDEQTGEKDE